MKLPSLLAAGILAASMPALAQDIDAEAQYRQSPGVLARYGDLPIALDTPALQPGRTTFTTQEEMLAYLAGLKTRNPAVVLDILGRSQQGRDIPYLLFTKEGLTDPAAIARLGRPVLWFVGQQHGNEPAGGEAMLALARMLAEGELKPLLDRVTVVVVPRANPDGAAAFTRATANKSDLNRDHILLTLPESRALHARLVELPPDVIVDAHEFSVANRWLQKFSAIQASDAMYLYATHPLVNPQITALADGLFKPAIDAAFRVNGLSNFWYHTTSYKTEDKLVSMGGNAPGIARNAFGLMGAVSFLVETRGVGVGMEAYQRRVATHVVVAKAVVETAAREAERLRAAVAKARDEAAADRRDLIVAHKPAVTSVDLPLLDPQTGELRPTRVDFQDSRVITPSAVRARPAGYLLTAEATTAVDELMLNGGAVCVLREPADIEVESFALAGPLKAVNREAINPEQALKVDLAARRLTLPAGTFYVPAGQTAGGLLSAALEPDSPGSFVGTGVVSLTAEAREAPIYRAGEAAAATLRLAPLSAAGAALCGG
ncbi:M14 family metallopeptidase [Chelatococcus sp. SYSU_G07232]|uniref:M14 family metallopeptidase n=1 Tax=Chelatococcus albus TaxID=3047466 RepID=A0ABT7ADE0_9HYPH|nr:M14 family metallopeptidase [Chelatococcus sp. SYSU_G07232]MDJ1157397.1 M14 family metallopeptidase [Chelatococcus sp. SYSU_G07232]